MKTNRREFLWVAGASIACLSQPSVWCAAQATSAPFPRDEFKRRLKGPILSFPTTYTQDYQVDHDGTRKMIRRALDAGIRVVAMTNGNNQYDQLSYEEIKTLTRVMVETVAGRAITIGATGPWWTGQAADYARFCESVGVSAVQILMSGRGDAESQFEHFSTIAKATRLALVVHGQPSLNLMKRLLTLDSIVAMKEEFTTDYTVPLYEQFGDRLNIFAGGTKARFLAYRPYGMQAYYSIFSTFAPEIAMRFWNAVQAGDAKEEREVILKYDAPLFQRFSAAFWQCTLEYFGMAKRYMRPPEKSFSDKQMEEVKAFYLSLGVHPHKV